MTSTAISVAFGPGPSDDFPYITNPVPIPALGFLAMGWPLLVLAIAASVASLVVRARRGSPVERKQIQWIAFAGAFFAAGFAASVLFPSITYWYVLVFVPVAGIAMACGVAIQRYRLYDIDRIISRTVSYALVTALLVAAYVGLVVLFQATTRPLLGRSDLAIAASTLIVAALFVPVRRRVQSAVDHRFNRRRYDAAQTIEAFGARLRDEIDIDTLGTELEAVVGLTMQPAHVSLWLRTSRQ
jgi:4-amino-4-deoxy-L-arabinose transferase-like glycosyltransferase